MERRARVELQDGGLVAGTVERFDPGLPDFVLRLEGGEVRRLRFAEVRTVAFLADDGAGPAPAIAGDEQLVTLRFAHGESIRGVLRHSQGPRRGVHLSPIGGRGVSHLFVPVSSIRDVVAVQNLGEILVREGLLAPRALEDAIARQREQRSRKLGEILQARGALDERQIERAVEEQRKTPNKRIGDVMLDLGFVSREQLDAAVEVQKMLRVKRLGELLIELGFADAKTIAIALALQFHLPFVTLSARKPEPALRTKVPAGFAFRWRVLPLELEDDLLTVAIADPTRLEWKDELAARHGVVVSEALATPAELDDALASFYAD